MSSEVASSKEDFMDGVREGGPQREVGAGTADGRRSAALQETSPAALLNAPPRARNVGRPGFTGSPERQVYFSRSQRKV
ncbi:hypothetical protein GCM10027432_27510 [Lysobacter fragariae]